MKHLKMLGLAALAAMAVTAFVGVSSASALDILCENNTSTPCNAKVAVNGIIKAEATTPVLTGSLEVHCEKSTATIKVTKNNIVEGATGEVNSLSWTNCQMVSPLIINCTVVTQNLPYHVEVTTPGGAASLTVKPKAGGKPGAKVVCGGLLSCTFLNSDFTLPIDSGNPASITANEIELEEKLGLCPEEAFWDAKYVAESPTGALFVRSS